MSILTSLNKATSVLSIAQLLFKFKLLSTKKSTKSHTHTTHQQTECSQMYITVTSHECNNIWNHWQHDCLFNRMFRPTTKKTTMVFLRGIHQCPVDSYLMLRLTAKETSKLCVTNPFLWESTNAQLIPITKGHNVERIFMPWTHHVTHSSIPR